MSYPRFEEIFNAKTNQFSGDDKELFHHFLESYYALSADEDLDGFSADSLCATAVTHFKLLLEFNRQADLVHVYNPSLEENGYQADCSVVDLVVNDRPFLVDSVLMAFTRLNLSTHFIVHPIFNYQRVEGSKASLSFAESSERTNVSVIHVEFDKLPDASLVDISDEIKRVLNMIDQTVNDWHDMEEVVKKVISEIQTSRNLPQTAEDIIEASNFLQWLVDGNFTFLGYREYTINENHELFSVGGSGLGVLKDDGVSRISSSFEKLPDKIKAKALEPRLLLFSKSNNLSVIHRPAYMDFIGVKRFDENGQVIGEHRFLGLLTAAAYRLFPKQIPMLSHKIDKIISATKLPKNSHVAKTFENILTQMPRDELFQAPVENIKEMALGIFHLSERAKIRAFTRIDTYETYISCFIFVPKEKYNTKLRRKIQNYLLDITNGYAAEFATRFGESLHVRVEILVRTRPGEINEFSDKEIEKAVSEMVTGWDDTVQFALHDELGVSKGNALFKTFERTTPISYKQDFLPLQAVNDFKLLSQLDDNTPLIPDLYLPDTRSTGASRANLALKLYGNNELVNISAILPTLEHFGFSVISATPYRFNGEDNNLGWMLNLLLKTDVEIDNFDVVKEQFAEAFLRIWHHKAESDNLDGLIFNEVLVARDIMVLRAIAKYMQQAKVSYSQEYIHNTLNKHTGIAELLVRLFHVKFDPAETAERDQISQELGKQIEAKLQEVSSLDEDKILRWYLIIINAMLRTNFYQTTDNGDEKPYLSFKLSSKDIPELPRPRPLYEIFVYSPFVEAIHLRGGKVARGGLRWSDRMEDFRTEVLGLVKAQIVKNAVIVPVGSKGGFVVKKMPKVDRDTVMQEVIRCYKMFISGMLDITDNIVEGNIVPPQNVYRHDEDDPYLVVAADKGTATFSDIANGVAIDYGFWLGDAFASGGSVGYDHKGMGITARGGWESVKRHFRHLGKDIQEKDDFTVVGIGDMGGDVFGNGMLLSKRIKLLAAFNHLHIFLDPNPADLAKSFAERERLFNTPRTTWDDYDKSLISAGGGVHSRSEKSIKITPEVATALAITEAELSPSDLINRLLQAPVDLLWNGGIGTYIKAETQSHAEVGDKANDALRINGNQLRCKVVGEGGNLGFTQLGRIEYAKNGGLILTDAIDNSAGVNCSDHEVNIKILLNQAVEKGDLTVEQRNELLASMTDEVGHLVLRQNYQQPQAIRLGQMNKNQFVDHARIMKSLEKAGQLDRSIEYLPDDKEIKRRLENNEGLTAPELAVVLAYSKINLFGKLVASDLPDDEVYQTDLSRYFPTPLREKYLPYMQTHPLRREIIATFLTNSILNHMGSVFILRASEETGKRPDQVVRAYTVSRNVFGAVNLWHAIDALDNKVHADLQNELHLRVRRLIELASIWFLQNRRDDAQTIEADFAGVGEAVSLLPKILPEAGTEQIRLDSEDLINKGVPAELAEQMALLSNAFLVLDIIELARQTNYQVEAMGSLYFKVADYLNAGWIRDNIAQLINNDYWRRRACASITQQLMSSINEITRQVSQFSQTPDEAFDKWVVAESAAIDSYMNCVTEVKQDTADMSRLSVVIGEMSVLARKPQQ